MEAGLDPKGRLSFTDLPPEIRNMIFRLTLVSNERLGIQALHPDEYQQQLGEGSCHARTAFLLAADPRRRYIFEVTTEGFETTYSLHRTLHGFVPSLAMLSLNNQTRKEATSIFYGLNTFAFLDLDCMIPFMLDRTAAVVKTLESFRLQFFLGHLKGIFCTHTPIAGCDTWTQAVSDLGKFEDLRLKRLTVDIEGQCNDLHLADGTFNLESPTTRWISALRESFSNLDMLGINYICSNCTCNIFATNMDYVDLTDHYEEILWDVLAPHMLKRYDDNHDGITLQHRRIPFIGSETDGYSNDQHDRSSNTREP